MHTRQSLHSFTASHHQYICDASDAVCSLCFPAWLDLEKWLQMSQQEFLLTTMNTAQPFKCNIMRSGNRKKTQYTNASKISTTQYICSDKWRENSTYHISINWFPINFRCTEACLFIILVKVSMQCACLLWKQEAQLSQRDRAAACLNFDKNICANSVHLTLLYVRALTSTNNHFTVLRHHVCT